MSSYLSQLQAEAHAADLREEAHRARTAHPGGTGGRRRERLRHWTARRLLALAVRLDGRLRPTAVRPSASAHCT